MIYFTHLLRDEEMREIVRNTGMGIESIEFSVSENLDKLQETMIAYEKRLSYMECESFTFHGPFLDLNPMAYDSLVRQATKIRYEQAYYAARTLGADKIIYHSCFVPQVYMQEGIAQRIADFYREFLEDKDEKIEILMENVLDPVPEPLVEAAEKIENGNFGLCLDMGHAHCYSNISVEKWARSLKPHIRHIHLHNNFGRKDSHFAADCETMDSLAVLDEIFTGKVSPSIAIECSTEEEVLRSWTWLKDRGFNKTKCCRPI